MRKLALMTLIVLVLLELLGGCSSSTQTGVRTSEHQSLSGGDLSVRIKSAQGAGTKYIEVGGSGWQGLDAEVTLSVGAGSYKLELLGEDDSVSLTLEAQGGETVSGIGWMALDGFDKAGYRITAADAQDVEYTIVYTFR